MRVALLLLLLGCGGSLLGSSVDPAPECRSYDDTYLAWKAVGVASAGLAGAAGGSGVLTVSLADEPGANIALAATSAAMGILATVAGMLAGEYAERAAACGGTR